MGRRCLRLLSSVALAILLLPALAFAQSPWERAASNLATTFTGPLARSLALVAIVIGGLLFMFGEAGAKRQISGIVFGGGLALFATQFLAALDNVINVVRTAGGGTQHIVKLLAFVTDLDAYRVAMKDIGEGWRARMGKYYPAMSLVKVAGLLEPGALVEIEGMAVLP